VVSLSPLSAFQWLLQQNHRCHNPNDETRVTQALSSSKTRPDSDVSTDANSVHIVDVFAQIMDMFADGVGVGKVRAQWLGTGVLADGEGFG